MKSSLLSCAFILFAISLGLSQNQKPVLYDNWPTTVPSNANRVKPSLKLKDPGTNFVPIGTTWNHRVITYFFQNGTADINANDERQAIRDGFALWSAETDLVFLEVCSDPQADIVILWGSFSHGDTGPFDGAGGTLAHTLGGPPPNSFGAQAGDIHFDDSETFTLATRTGNAQPIDLVTVAAHEIGHALGLDHTSVAGSLMLPTYTGSHRYLGYDDLGGIRNLYGNKNNNLITASNLNLNTQSICNTTANLSVVNVPAGATVTWQSSNPSALTVSSTGVATRVNNGTGQVTVTARITNACSSAFTEVTKVVNVGGGGFGGTYNYGGGTYNITGSTGIAVSNSSPSIYINLTNVYDPSATYVWSTTYQTGNSSFSASGKNATITLSGGASRNISCYATTPCGVTSVISFSCYNYSSGSFRIASFPNPVDQHLTLEAVPLESTEGQLNEALLVEANSQLVNKFNQTVWSGKLEQGKVSFSTASLPEGIYYLRVDNGKKVVTKQIVIQH